MLRVIEELIDEALLASILGNEADPGCHGPRRRCSAQLAAGERDGPGVVGVDSEDRPRHLAPARPDETGQRDDLAGPHLEADVEEDAFPRETLDIENGLAGGMVRHHAFGKLTSDHRAHQIVGVEALELAGEDEPAVAENRDSLAECEDLFEPVGDEEHGDAGLVQRGGHLEEAVDLDGRERGRRLVHDDDSGIERQGLGDLDQLLLGDREAERDPVEVEPDAEPLEDRLGLSMHCGGVDPATGAQRLAADEDVLDDREVGEERRLLVDDGDPAVARVGRAGQGDLDAVDEQLPAVRRVHAGEDLHERRFAGSVLADESVSLARVEIDRDVVERADRPESLGCVLEREDGHLRRRCRRHCSGFVLS